MLYHFHFRDLFLGTAFALSLALPAPAASAAKNTTASEPVAQSAGADDPLAVILPRMQTDLPPDPGSLAGRLPNGMTYLIYKHVNSEKTIALRLRIAGGSMMENDTEWGGAHFIEHMAFTGTRHIPKDTLIPMLQKMGVEFGPDAGAFTEPEQTRFVLNISQADTKKLTSAMQILREMVSNIQFDPDTVNRERKVILGEKRVRETPLVLATDAWQEKVFTGQKFAMHGNAMGSEKAIRTITPQQLEALYHVMYRPELATLIVVGNVDPKLIEKQIQTTFSGWKATGPFRKEDFGIYTPSGLNTFSLHKTGLQDQILLTWFKPYDARPQTIAEKKASCVQIILLSQLNRVLQIEANLPESAFTAAAIGERKIRHTADLQQLMIMAKKGMARKAYRQVLTTFFNFLHTDAAGDKTKIADMMKTQAKNLSATFSNIPNSTLADLYLMILNQNNVAQSPEQGSAFMEDAARHLQDMDFQNALKTFMYPDGPQISFFSADSTDLDEATLKTNFLKIRREVTAQNKKEETASADKPDKKTASEPSGKNTKTADNSDKKNAVEWPYTDFGTPQQPDRKTEFPKFELTRYHFANGVTLNVRHTTFQKDRILVRVSYKGGLKSISPQTKAPVQMAKLFTFMGGYFFSGVKKISTHDTADQFDAKAFGLLYALNEDAATVTGQTSPKNFRRQVELMIAYLTDPAYQEDSYKRATDVITNLYTSLSTNPEAYIELHLDTITHPGDNRYAFTLDAKTASHTGGLTFPAYTDIRQLLQQTQNNRPIEITIIGDITPEAAKQAVAETFATLPKLPDKAPVATDGDKTQFPDHPKHIVQHYNGTKNKAVTLLIWPVPGALENTQTSEGLEVLSQVLRLETYRVLREKLGQVYDPEVTLQQSWGFPHYGVIALKGTIAPGQDAAFVQAVHSIIADLCIHPVSQDLLEAARAPLISHWKEEQTDNTYWSYILPHITAASTAENTNEKERNELNKVTPEMVQKLVKTYLTDDRLLHVEVTPTGATPTK